MSINPASHSSHPAVKQELPPLHTPLLPSTIWAKIGKLAGHNTALALRQCLPQLTSQDYLYFAFGKDQENTLASTIVQKLISQNLFLNAAPPTLKTCRAIAPRVRALDLSNLTLTPDHIEQLALLFPLVEKITSKAKVSEGSLTKLSNFKNLRDLDCSNCGLSGRHSIPLLPLAQLKKLNLGNNPLITGSNFNLLPESLLEFDCSSCAVTNQALPFLTKLTNLRKLNLSHNKGINLGLLSPVPLPQSLTELDCSFCSNTDGATRLSHLTNLQKLKLGGNPEITGGAFDQLPQSLLEFDCVSEGGSIFQRCNLEDFVISRIAHLKHLQKLALTGSCPLFTGCEFNYLPDSLVELSCKGASLNDDAIGKLAHLKNLQKLDVQYHRASTGTNYIHLPKTDRAITGRTFDRLPPSLTEFNCGYCSLTDEGIGLLHHLVNLQKLDVSQNHGITGSTFDLLPPSLKEFDCSKCSVTNDGIRRFAHLDALLKLRIGSNQIDDTDIAHLAHLKNLQKLDAANNNFTGRTIKFLPPTLSELNISGCPIINEALGNLGHLKKLVKLDISGSKIDGSTLHLLPLWLNHCNVTCSSCPFVGYFFHNFFMMGRNRVPDRDPGKRPWA